VSAQHVVAKWCLDREVPISHSIPFEKIPCSKCRKQKKTGSITCTTSTDAWDDAGCGLKFCTETCCGDAEGTWSTDEVSGKTFYTCMRCAPEQELQHEMDEVTDSIETLEEDVEGVDVEDGLDVELEEHLDMRQQLDE